MIPVIIDLMADGASIVEVCANLGVTRTSFYRWLADKDKIPLKEAVEAGELLSQAWWENQGRTSLRDDMFNSTLWYMNMKNRFKWADKQEITGANGGAIETHEIGEKETDKRIIELLNKLGEDGVISSPREEIQGKGKKKPR